MNILNTGVMHAPFAPGFRIQCAFKNRSENSRADGTPVKSSGHIVTDDVEDFFCNSWNFYSFIGKKAAIHIRKSSQIFPEVRISVFLLRIQYFKQLNQTIPGILPFPSFQIIPELIDPPKIPASSAYRQNTIRTQSTFSER